TPDVTVILQKFPVCHASDPQHAYGPRTVLAHGWPVQGDVKGRRNARGVTPKILENTGILLGDADRGTIFVPLGDLPGEQGREIGVDRLPRPLQLGWHADPVPGLDVP